jgi:hypothetical protein
LQNDAGREQKATKKKNVTVACDVLGCDAVWTQGITTQNNADILTAVGISNVTTAFIHWREQVIFITVVNIMKQREAHFNFCLTNRNKLWDVVF